MKSTITLMFLVSLFMTSLLYPQATATTQIKTKKEWKNYGGTITVKKAMPLSEVVGGKENKTNKEIVVEGVISEVCQNKGCWMVVKDKDKNVRVEFKDYGFFVPWDSEGKKIRMLGKIEKKTVSDKAAKHMAGEMKDPPIKSEDIKKEQDISVFTASAVAIEGGSVISAEQQEILDGKKEKEGHEHEGHDH